MTDTDLKSAVEEVRAIYQQQPISKNWNDPTRQQMIDSLNKAHSANKVLVAALDKALLEVMNGRKWIRRLLWAFGLTWTIIGFLLKLFLPYAIKGMLT
ncbi:MAG TPA: hypothetical protein VFO27_11445 [Bryobacteraceae bacterium]|nr:hypothetical protein [Bryobacteraceae bacterium]